MKIIYNAIKYAIEAMFQMNNGQFILKNVPPVIGGYLTFINISDALCYTKNFNQLVDIIPALSIRLPDLSLVQCQHRAKFSCCSAAAD